jgi:uncharacterized membrane protein
MSIDPNIKALFKKAEQSFDPDAFLPKVMAQINRERRRSIVVWAIVAVAAVTGFLFLATPVVTAASMATELLPVSLVEIETDWLRLLLAPINSVAAAVAIGVLLLRKFFRRISS